MGSDEATMSGKFIFTGAAVFVVVVTVVVAEPTISGKCGLTFPTFLGATTATLRKKNHKIVLSAHQRITFIVKNRTIIMHKKYNLTVQEQDQELCSITC